MSQIPSAASQRARRAESRHPRCPTCKSADVDGNHVLRCNDRERYRKHAVAAGAEHGVLEVTMNDLWAHIGGRCHNDFTAALIAEVVVDLGWRPPVDGKPAAAEPTPPPAAAVRAESETEGDAHVQ